MFNRLPRDLQLEIIKHAGMDARIALGLIGRRYRLRGVADSESVNHQGFEQLIKNLPFVVDRAASLSSTMHGIDAT